MQQQTDWVILCKSLLTENSIFPVAAGFFFCWLTHLCCWLFITSINKMCSTPEWQSGFYSLLSSFWFVFIKDLIKWSRIGEKNLVCTAWEVGFFGFEFFGFVLFVCSFFGCCFLQKKILLINIRIRERHWHQIFVNSQSRKKFLFLPKLYSWKSWTPLISSLLWGGSWGHMVRQKGSEFIPTLNTLSLDLCSPPCTGKVVVCVLFSHLVDETNWALRLLLCLKWKTEIQSENMMYFSIPQFI